MTGQKRTKIVFTALKNEGGVHGGRFISVAASGPRLNLQRNLSDRSDPTPFSENSVKKSARLEH